MGKDYATVIRATGQPEKAYFCKPLKYRFGKQWSIHKFLYLPKSPKHLLGRNLLKQLQVTIKFKNEEVILEVNNEQYIQALSLMLTAVQIEGKISEEIINQLFPGVWASNVPRRAKNAPPIVIKLKERKQPIKIKQYPLKREDRKKISSIVKNFLQLKLLKECESKFNTPILLVQKPNGSYQIVQDLTAVNKITEDLYPVVANPYTLLTCLTPELT